MKRRRGVKSNHILRRPSFLKSYLEYDKDKYKWCDIIRKSVPTNFFNHGDYPFDIFKGIKEKYKHCLCVRALLHSAGYFLFRRGSGFPITKMPFLYIYINQNPSLEKKTTMLQHTFYFRWSPKYTKRKNEKAIKKNTPDKMVHKLQAMRPAKI